ncbi:DUF177 domain-containing protein [Facklamia languida]
MKWTVQKIYEACRGGDLLSFSEEIDITGRINRRKTDILHLEKVQADGYFLLQDGAIILHYEMTTKVTLPSTRSLKSVVVPLTVKVKERYVDQAHDTNAQDYEEVTIGLEDDQIDLADSVADNLVLNLPVRVIGEDEEDQDLPSGQDWKVISEESYKMQQAAKKEEEDPRFAALKTLKIKSDDQN